MKPREIDTLKRLALLGGTHKPVVLSSKELSGHLGISQQAASKHILNLLEEGMITRTLGARKQRIELTDKGFELLRNEYADYKRIFEMKNTLVIQGEVTTGLGEGQYYINQREYGDQFLKKLWFKPYRGTLNIGISGSELNHLDVLKRSGGILIKGFERGGRTFGDVRAFLCSIKNVECAVVIPDRSHHTGILEVISKYHLRRTLGLRDGDIVELVVTLG